MYRKIHHAVCDIDTDDYHATEWFRDKSGNEYETEMGVRALTNSGNHCLIKIGKNYYIAKRGRMKDSCIETYLDKHWHPDGFIQICNGDLKERDRVWMKIGHKFEYGLERAPKDPIRKLFFDAGLNSNRDKLVFGREEDPVEDFIRKSREDCEGIPYTYGFRAFNVFSESGQSYANVSYDYYRKGRLIPKMHYAIFKDTKPSIKEAKDLIDQILKYCNA